MPQDDPIVPQEAAKFLETYWRRDLASKVEGGGKDQRRADGKIVGVELAAAVARVSRSVL